MLIAADCTLLQLATHKFEKGYKQYSIGEHAVLDDKPQPLLHLSGVGFLLRVAHQMLQLFKTARLAVMNSCSILLSMI